jgi:adenine-specific DNA methylase
VEAILGAGFSVVNAHPVKAEISVAAPKAQAKEPIQLDIVLICKKKEHDERGVLEPPAALNKAINRTYQKLVRLQTSGFKLSQNDRRIIVMSQFISALGPVASPEIAVHALKQYQARLAEVANHFPDSHDTRLKSRTAEETVSPLQQTFWID